VCTHLCTSLCHEDCIVLISLQRGTRRTVNNKQKHPRLRAILRVALALPEETRSVNPHPLQRLCLQPSHRNVLHEPHPRSFAQVCRPLVLRKQGGQWAGRGKRIGEEGK
jgi:hypothetical protein